MTPLSPSFKIPHLILAAALTTGLGFVNHANAETAFLVDLNSRTAIDLGASRGDWSNASGINDAGQVVGQAFTAEGSDTQPFITGPDGVGIRDLGTLGGRYSNASGINDAGQVVGDSVTAEGGYAHAFITGPDGKGMVDLNSLVDLPGIILTQAAGINNNGQVIAMGVFPVIPEPETYALMLAGLGLIGFIAWRKNNAT